VTVELFSADSGWVNGYYRDICHLKFEEIIQRLVAVEEIRALLQKYWGYDTFRPLQLEAITAVLANHDSVVVLPTGGGKSLCFQAPAVKLPGLAVVVSPLISLMKDQVDSLTECGVPAACVNSSLTASERAKVAKQIRDGSLKLLYIAPERLCTDQTREFLKQSQISFFAIDEAHCISSWGHDFRPEYRALGLLKEEFPGVAIHAYTATATEAVRADIARQLKLDSPQFHVGNFDRPNLVYRVQPRADHLKQIRDVLERHRGEAGIIYCIRRTDCEELSETLNRLGHRTRPYHAGLTDEQRIANQDAFLKDEVDTIVATVAFGMGIDKSNVRYVIHAAAPKSLEAYQQESGRAGRDGLEAECVVLYSNQDFILWRRMQEGLSGDAGDAAAATLRAIEGFCVSVNCRHQQLVEYFGQTYAGASCSACDVCLQELDFIEDSLVLSQKILSCVVRVQQKFGADYVANVLVGSREQRILDNGHDRLTTYGLLKEMNKKDVRSWIEQLLGQGYLVRTGEFHVIALTPTGRQVLKSEITPRLLRPLEKKSTRQTSKAEVTSWEGVDRGLFEDLRILRRDVAESRSVASFMIFSDATLRDMARRRPGSLDVFQHVSGVGEKKSADYGEQFVARIRAYCLANNVPLDQKVAPVPASEPVESSESKNSSMARVNAIAFFRDGKSVAEVAELVGRAVSTTAQYLSEYLVSEQITDVTPWVDEATLARIEKAAHEVGLEKLRPIYDYLEETVPFEQIRIALTCLQNRINANSQ